MAQFDKKIHIVQHYVTESILGVLGSKVPDGSRKKVNRTAFPLLPDVHYEQSMHVAYSPNNLL